MTRRELLAGFAAAAAVEKLHPIRAITQGARRYLQLRRAATRVYSTRSIFTCWRTTLCNGRSWESRGATEIFFTTS